jgi:AcrR family transcriptional regulator
LPPALRRGAEPLPAPHKRPVQDRSKFTIQAIYDAYVRIWRRDGPESVTTRGVAQEAGFAVGTLYEYFPNKAALHSGYVRHAMDRLHERIDHDVIAETGLGWSEGLRRLVNLSCGVFPQAPYFDVAMLNMENEIADLKRHQQAFNALSDKWFEAMSSWPDLQPAPSREVVTTRLLAGWGARRYHLLVSPDGIYPAGWVNQLVEISQRALAPAAGGGAVDDPAPAS